MDKEIKCKNCQYCTVKDFENREHMASNAGSYCTKARQRVNSEKVWTWTPDCYKRKD